MIKNKLGCVPGLNCNNCTGAACEDSDDHKWKLEDRSMTKVYIVYQKDGYGGQEVQKVFGNRDIGREWIIKNLFRGNGYYLNRTIEELNKFADSILEEHELVN